MNDDKDNGISLNENDEHFCILQAQIALEQFVQVKIIADLLKEEQNQEHKEILMVVYKEEKEEFLKAKAEMDKCMYLNGNPNNYEKKK